MSNTHTTEAQHPVSQADAFQTPAEQAPYRQGRPPPAWIAPSAVAAAALAACGGGGDPSMADTIAPGLRQMGAALPPAGLQAVASTTYAGGAAGPLGYTRLNMVPADDRDASRFLQQCQFSASDAEIAKVRALGYAGYLAQQFDVIPTMTTFAWLNQRGYNAIDSRFFHFTPYQADYAIWMNIFTTNDVVRKRVALALSEIFSVSINGTGYYWPSHAMANWWDTLSANALGTFRTLLDKVSLHIAMGMYLNTRGSQKENDAGRQPDENFPRELMQLMTIGLVMLNADGTPITSGGVPLESYTQSDVTNLARVFTGYGYNWAANTYTPYNNLSVPSTTFIRLPMAMDPSLHSPLAANFLGTSIPADTDPALARKIALDTLADHPNVGPFIGKQLIQRLVTSNPSPDYVARVSAAFADNGKGVRGDLAATVAAVLLDDEARGAQGLTSPTYGKLREPMLRIAQWGRTFGFNSARGSWKMYDTSSTTLLAQSPLRASSIFNFFRPGYVPPGTSIADAGMVAPEFQLVNETTVSGYINYLVTLLRYGVYVAAPNQPEPGNNATDGFDLAASYAAEIPIAHDAAALVARLNLLMAAGQLSSDTVDLIVTALSATPLSANSSTVSKRSRIAAALLLIMSSAEYLVQK
ncbi:DUF1800 domain-containing protein [Xylophilus sp. GOD-11R]|uniref:DUF1800 domain-containing protein n=1 Tax=Xylophilus sp. GOD-11R TaxID=3089814 RepID=UPI00298C1D2F|nr:DUF1800 family protein [Xylophilus sp. GOD-11R]WPB56927.1 DUF1800 family protein [Xylophilus sp. GOD-11R]